MGFGKVLKIFKKGAKAASGSKKGGGASAKWPSGIRIGLFGHANSGKTVYFTVLNEDCKIAKDLQIAVSDASTAGQLLAHFRSIWGVGTTTDVGTHVDLKGDKKFPTSTSGERVFQFHAILDRGKKVPVVTLDYDGQAVSISGASAVREKVLDFMSGCQGLLLFFDPKILGSVPLTQEHVAGFTHLMELMGPLSRRLPVPVALVINKADILPGFSGDEQTVLVPPEDEHFLASDFALFLEKILASNQLASNPVWAGTVRDILIRLQEFLKVVVGRTLNFQIFFVSNTGQTPKKIGTEVGRSLYAPPDRITPIGVRRPFYWLLGAVLKNRGINRIAWMTKWVTLVSICWMTLYSLPNLYHFSYALPQLWAEEDAILDAHKARSGTLADLSQSETSKITANYRKYESKWLIKSFYVPYRREAEQTVRSYNNLERADVGKILEAKIQRFHDIAIDSTNWPLKKVGDTIFAVDDNAANFVRLHAEVDSLIVLETDLDNSSRRERLLWFIARFRSAILLPEQSQELWEQIVDQVIQSESREDVKLSPAETSLATTLKTYEKKQEVVRVAQETGSDVEAFLETINDNTDPKFRLVTVPARLRTDLATLSADPANAPVMAKIQAYLKDVKKFKTRRAFVFKLADAPDGYHAHVMARKGKTDTPWRVGKQLHPGIQVDTISWRMKDQIVIALDSPSDGESWGANSTLKKELKGDVAIFQLMQPITVGADKTIVISLETDLEEMLPRIK